MNELTRETGAFPLSIGTSLAIEGFLGRHPNQPKYPTGYRDITEIWVNIRTLSRNIVDALPADAVDRFHMQEVLDIAVEELQTLSTVVSMETTGKVSVIYYTAVMEEVLWKFPNAKYKKPKTERQITRAAMDEFIHGGLKATMQADGVALLEVKTQPPQTPKAVALLTHYPHELFWRYSFAALFLLESHTGKLKPYSRWSSKLKSLPSEARLPFTRFTLQVFGDGSYILAQPKAMRDEVLRIAADRKWNAVTTDDKIYSDISKVGSDAIKALYGELMSR